MKIKPPKEQVFSPVKWEKQQKLLKSMRLIDDRNALKVLNREEIIAYRLPFHEAVLRKLNREGFVNSAEYLQQLIDFQDSYRKAAGEESIIWQRPRLIYQQNILNHLADNLVKAEQAHFSKHTDVEIDILLKLATEFCFGSEHWWWLGHQLLFITLKTCEDYNDDRGKRMALLRYLFGRFLFENGKEPQMALEHLKVARKLSAEMSWNINLLFDESATIFSRVCTIMSKIRMIQARSIMQKDPKSTLRLCETARKRALEGCYYEGAIEAYILRGNCEMSLFDTENAIKSFKKGIEILDKHDNVGLRCEILKNLAIAYLKHGSLNSALTTLQKLNEFANREKKMEYIAQAHKYLGEYYLKEGTARNATPLLMAAVKIFAKAGFNMESAKTMNMAAISVEHTYLLSKELRGFFLELTSPIFTTKKDHPRSYRVSAVSSMEYTTYLFLSTGIELMPIFSKIVKNGDPKFCSEHKENLSKLISWKDRREDFWKDSRFSHFTLTSNQTADKSIPFSTVDITLDNLPDDDLDFEELIGITGLDTGNTTQASISSMTDDAITDVEDQSETSNPLMLQISQERM